MPLLHDRHICSCARHSGSGSDGFHSKFAPTHFPPDLSLEPKHIDIALDIDVEGRRAIGTVTTTIVANRNGANVLTLNAVDFENLSVEASNGEITHTYDGEKIVVTWGEGFQKGDTCDVAISYTVDNPIAGLYFSHPDHFDVEVGTWAATDHETERARHWLPCIDHPNVRTTLAFHLTTDSSFTALANGAKVSEDVSGDKKTTHWALDFPCPSYLCCFALGEFSTFEDGEFENLPVAYFASSLHNSERLERSFGRTKEMLEWMTKKLGVSFPFPKYFQFALPGIGGAMENISLVSWDDVFVLDEKLAEEWTWLVDQVNVHEMAHSYFGDAVVCRDFAHVWLKESWATYMEQCWLEDKYGADERDYDFYRNSTAYFEESDTSYKRPIVTRVFDSSWDMFDRHLYPGGAARLHTLRHELGDETFWSGVNRYLSENIGKAVETSDFRRALEAESGRSLVSFFEQWFHTAGYPDLDVSFAFDSDKKEGTFTVTQKQVDEKGEGPKFELNLEFGWVIEGTLHTGVGTLSDRKNTFRFDIESDPEQVRVDPNNTTLFKLSFNPGRDKLAKQLTDAPDIVGRIKAAHELAKIGGRKNVDALSAAYQNENFWGVRQQIAKAIAKIPLTRATSALQTIVESEQDPMVLESVFTSCHGIRDESLWGAVRARIDGSLPYRAERAAWIYIGRSGQTPEEMRSAAMTNSYHGFVQDGALLGLAATREIANAEVLVEATKATFPTRVRQSAARALGGLGKYAEDAHREQIADTLSTLLRDPDPSVGWAASAGLVAMKATSKAANIEQFLTRLAEQDRVTMRRHIGRLRDPEKNATAALSKQVDELRTELRKLAEKIEELS